MSFQTVPACSGLLYLWVVLPAHTLVNRDAG
jgi:hypothetical protein